MLGWLAHAYASAGRRGDAEAILKELFDRNQSGVVDPLGIATACIALSDTQGALDWIERGIESRGMVPILVTGLYHFDSLRGDLRFEKAMHPLCTRSQTPGRRRELPERPE